VDFVLHEPGRLLAIEEKVGANPGGADARPLIDLLADPTPAGIEKGARRLGVIVTRGREVVALAPHVWAVPDWRLFGPMPE
jgi:hypothetical protein